MAATSLWHIEGRLKDLISYVENPEKTVPNKEMQDFFDVFSYVKNPQKTDNGEFVSAINCLKETALQQMILTKKQYQKTGGYIAWHGYQSFKPDEVTPEQCHEIGLKLAREMWGDKYQIIVVTHLDRGHLHNHFCFNSVSYLDGSKYNYSKSEQKRLRETSDRLCREYGLSVIENPKKAPSRPLYLDEKSGKPTRYNVYLEDLAEAISGSRDIPHMMKYLIDKGYTAIDEYSRWRYVEAFEEHSTYSSAQFLKHLIQRFPMPIECVQTDNGVEFTKRFSTSGKETLTLFQRTLKELGIQHKLIRPFTPRHNGKVERSHRKDNERFYTSHTFYSFEDFSKQLQTYNRRDYNQFPMRPLGWKSPQTVLREFIDRGVTYV